MIKIYKIKFKKKEASQNLITVKMYSMNSKKFVRIYLKMNLLTMMMLDLKTLTNQKIFKKF